MKLLDTYTVSFFGHRYIDNILLVEEILEEQIYTLLKEKEYVIFLLGRNGDFDQCVASTVKRVQKNYRDDNSELTLVLPYPTSEYKNNIEHFEEYYDNVQISYNASKAHPKAAFQIRNREMVEIADLIICYVEESYGGAYQTIEYAKKQNKNIINIVDVINETR